MTDPFVLTLTYQERAFCTEKSFITTFFSSGWTTLSNAPSSTGFVPPVHDSFIMCNTEPQLLPCNLVTFAKLA